MDTKAMVAAAKQRRTELAHEIARVDAFLGLFSPNHSGDGMSPSERARKAWRTRKKNAAKKTAGAPLAEAAV